MATFNDRIVVAIDIVTNRAQKGMKQISSASKQADGAMGKFRATTGAAMTQLRAQGPLAAAAAGAAFIKFGNDAVNAAASQQEQINALNRTYEESAPAIREIGEAAQESMGLSRTEFAQAAVSFSGFVEAITKGSGSTTENLGDLMQRAADFGSRFELETSEALRIFRSALAGEIEPIRKFGIGLNAAAVQAHALETGILSAGDAMTEDIKIQARYSLLMQETANTQGDFAVTSEDLVNSRKRLSASLKNIVADLGDLLIPTVETATNFFNDLIDVMQTDIQLGDIKLGSGWDWFQDLASVNLGNLFTDPIEDIGRRWNAVWDSTPDDPLAFLESEAWAEQQAGYLEEWRREIAMAESAAIDYSKSQRLVAEAVDEAAAAHREEQAALDAARQARKQAAETSLDLADAQDAYIAGLDEMNELLADNSASQREKDAAVRDVIRSLDDMVNTELELAGVSQDQQNYTRDWTAAWVEHATYLSGPARQAVIDYISEVTGIPEEQVTDVITDYDPEQVDQVKDDIAQKLSRAEAYAQINVSEPSLANARARLEYILGRPVTVDVRTRGGTDFGTPGGGRVRHSGGRLGKGQAAQVLAGEVFVPDGPGRVYSKGTSERMMGGGGGVVAPTFNIQGVSAAEVQAIVYGILRDLER